MLRRTTMNSAAEACIATGKPLAATATSSAARENWAALDGLRGWAIIFVIAVHSWAHSSRAGTGIVVLLPIGTRTFDITWVLATGHNAVIVFFVLSGFLLYQHWLERQNKMQFSAQLRSFAESRIRRILPAYAFYMCLYLALIAVVGKHRFAADLGASNFLLNLAFLTPIANLAPVPSAIASSLDVLPGTWSLNAEIWFYAAMPFVAALLGRVRGRWTGWLLLAAAMTAPLSRTLMGARPDWILRYSVFGVFDGFLVGMATAAIFSGKKENGQWSWLFPAGLVYYVFICAGRAIPAVDYPFQIAIASGLMIMGLIAAPASVWRSSLERPWIVNLGRWSFGLFLANVLVAWYVVLPISQALIVEPGLPLLALNFLVGVPVMVVLARSTHLTFEQPVIKRVPVIWRDVVVRACGSACLLLLISLVFSAVALLRNSDAEFKRPLLSRFIIGSTGRKL
jgi:peptidoglycan/LPS O-acetylase OafA/YrhL